MMIFAVVTLLPNPAVQDKVESAYLGANYRASDTVWLVADQGVTPQEVCQKLGVQAGGISGVVVLLVANYFGLAPKSLWDWLSVKAKDD